MSRERRDLFERLLPVAVGLYTETAELSAGDGDLQLWYNRGYADGMTTTMRQLGYGAELDAVATPIPLAMDEATALLPWGKAYRHGYEMGERETREVLSG